VLVVDSIFPCLLLNTPNLVVFQEDSPKVHCEKTKDIFIAKRTIECSRVRRV